MAAYTYEQEHTVKWMPTGSSIKLTLGETKVLGSPEHEIWLEDDIWEQVALTLEWKGAGYEVQLYLDRLDPHYQIVKGPFSFGTSLLPTSGLLVVGQANDDADTAMKIYLSELRVWNHLRDHQTLAELADMLACPKALDRYAKDPFDPHAIAALRMNAYQKTVVMKYIDNLIDWGDDLFRQD